jgi:hypothetical protein
VTLDAPEPSNPKDQQSTMQIPKLQRPKGVRVVVPPSGSLRPKLTRLEIHHGVFSLEKDMAKLIADSFACWSAEVLGGWSMIELWVGICCH